MPPDRSLSLTTLLALGVAAAVARGDAVELRSGRTLVGTVRLSGADEVVIDSVFPESKTVTLKRYEIAPGSLHTILDRLIDPADAARRREVGEFAETHGLLLSATIDFEMVKKLDPATAKDMDARIARLEEAIAREILADAQGLLDGGRPNTALLRLRTLRQEYGHTDAARKAESVATAAHDTAGASVEVAGRTASSRRAPIHHKSARAPVESLPLAASVNRVFDARVPALRPSSKSKLIDAYLAAGTTLLERHAIGGAEEYCNSACALDPQNKGSRRLRGLILQAKIFGYRAQTGSSR